MTETVWHLLCSTWWLMACQAFVQTRITEGEHLKNDLIDKLDNMLELVTRIEKRSPLVVDEYRVRS